MGVRRCLVAPCAGRRMKIVLAAALFAALAGVAQARLTTIYYDDFEAQTIGGLPGTPPVGLPWQTTAATTGTLGVVADPTRASTKVLQLGQYYNIATAPFSAAGETTIAGNQNMALNFMFCGAPDTNGYTPMFTAEADGSGGQPALLIRVMPQPNAGTGSGNFHEVYYLSPSGGLLDSGLSMPGGSWQNFSISANLAAHDFSLSIGSSSTTLPMYAVPSTIYDAQFSSYVLASGLPPIGKSFTLGSGLLDNVSVTSQSAPSFVTNIPEPATFWLMVSGGLLYALAWVIAAAWNRKGR